MKSTNNSSTRYRLRVTTIKQRLTLCKEAVTCLFTGEFNVTVQTPAPPSKEYEANRDKHIKELNRAFADAFKIFDKHHRD